jgi:tRNA dimethylallyltransferase
MPTACRCTGKLAILTARPSEADLARAPHALYGVVSGREAYSAGRYGVDAANAIAEARAQGRLPIIVGGTGLYFKALLEGLSPVPATDPQVRAYWRGEAARRPAPELHALLAQRDPEMAARLMPTDPQRVVRALEVLESTGRSLADWQRQPGTPVLAGADTLRLLVLPDRDELGSHIDARFDAMLAEGAVEECAGCWLSDSPTSCRSCGRSGWRSWPSCPRGSATRCRRGGRQVRDAPVRQTAGHLASTKYAVLEIARNATNGKNRSRRYRTC